jgi:ATP-dependent DNA helicase RecG
MALAVFMNLFDPVQFLKGVGPQVGKRLGSMGIFTLFDLVGLLPIGYNFFPINGPDHFLEGCPSSSHLRILRIEKGRKIWKVKVEILPWPGQNRSREKSDLSLKEKSFKKQEGFFPLEKTQHSALWGELVFFNHSPILKHPAMKIGSYLFVKGIWKKSQDALHKNPLPGLGTSSRSLYELCHPKDIVFLEKEPTKESEKEKNWSCHEVVYPSPRGVSSKKMGQWIEKGLRNLNFQSSEWIPKEILEKHHWESFLESLKLCHSVSSLEDLDPSSPGRSRLAFDEILVQQLLFLNSQKERKKLFTPPIMENPQWIKTLVHNFGFSLTAGQEEIFKDIQKDLKSCHPMMRLVHGDVGSGKTLLAFLALFHVISSGKQGVFLAPTEILAQQHKKTLDLLSKGLPIHSALLTRTSTKKQQIYDGIAQHKIHLIIGTHALLEAGVKFADLGLVVIDEQQRFGVQQRLSLIRKGEHHSTQQGEPLKSHLDSLKNSSRKEHPQNEQKSSPGEKIQGVNLLLLSATPIPRTMSLCLWGDLDVSLLKDKPGNRPPVQTFILPASRLEVLEERIGKQLENNQRVYWVCPAVEENAVELVAAEQRYQELSKKFSGGVALLHGKLPKKEKDLALEDFYQGRKPLLVSTTVIEVGVHVPEANIMVVEQSERFGLSQLHQLRGRVGRGDDPSYCFFIHSLPISSQGKERLQILKNHQDGFLIAHHDWKIRGGGDRMGFKQSGLPSYRFFNWEFHHHFISEARSLAQYLYRIWQQETALLQEPGAQLSRSSSKESPLHEKIDGQGCLKQKDFQNQTQSQSQSQNEHFTHAQPLAYGTIKNLLKIFQEESTWESLLAG